MNADQLSFGFYTRLLSDQKAQSVGVYGESILKAHLESRGYVVSYTHPGEHRGDLRAVDTNTGEIIRVECKTARRGRDGRWTFTLEKAGKTSARHSDIVILLAALKSGACVPFVIPIGEIGMISKICIPTHPEDYAGKWAKYRQHMHSLTLEIQTWDS